MTLPTAPTPNSFTFDVFKFHCIKKTVVTFLRSCYFWLGCKFWAYLKQKHGQGTKLLPNLILDPTLEAEMHCRVNVIYDEGRKRGLRMLVIK